WILRHPLRRRYRRAIFFGAGVMVFLVAGAIDLVGGHPKAGQIGEGALIVVGVEWWLEEYVSRARRVMRRMLGTRQRRLLNGPRTR
ncbi:MAG TPA: hypothetical protein VK662_12620, partial [Acidothermaceae bacterium]|nr:hypothetical protein [Acidothermaceae bacterium]